MMSHSNEDVDLNRISNELNNLLEDSPVNEMIVNVSAFSSCDDSSEKALQRNGRPNKKLNKLEQAKNYTCKNCSRKYKSRVWFDKHHCNLAKKAMLKEIIAEHLACKTTMKLFAELPLCDDELVKQTNNTHSSQPMAFKSFLDQLRELKTKEFAVLHLNINSVFNKINDLNQILDSKLYDIVTINESKLDEEVPISFFTNLSYSCLRRDRKGKGGGGLLVFVKKQYNIVKTSDSYKGEVISFQIKINNNHYNFISCYKSPSIDDQEFIDELGNILFEFDPAEPLFIIGDLNMDLASSKGDVLKSFLANFNLRNFVFEYTRVCKKFYRKNNKAKSSKTIIDVVLHNSDLITSTKTIDCPFSDHRFVSIKIRLNTLKEKKPECMGRALSLAKLDVIKKKLSLTEFEIDFNQNVNSNLNETQKKIRLIMDEFSPIKSIKLKKGASVPGLTTS